MDKHIPVLKPHITELNLTLLKILYELQTIKTQQLEIIEIISKDKQSTPKVPTNEEVSRGWLWS